MFNISPILNTYHGCNNSTILCDINRDRNDGIKNKQEEAQI
jgi:hypothetical protein